jgi:hypothetical protein
LNPALVHAFQVSSYIFEVWYTRKTDVVLERGYVKVDENDK